MKSNRKKRIIAAVLCMVMVLTSNISALAGGEIFVDTPAAVEELSSEPAAVAETEPEVSVSDTEAITEAETSGEFSAEPASETPAGSETTAPSEEPAAEAAAEVTFSDGEAETEAPSGETQEPEAVASPTPEAEATPEAEEESAADFGDGAAAEEQVLSGATELKQEFTDADGNVIQRVTANLPMGAFAAETSAVTMEVNYLDTDSANYVKSMMTQLLPEGMQLGTHVFFDIEFKVNGEKAEALQPITITIEGSNLTITDTKKANVFYLRKADPEVEGDKDELKEIPQRAEVLESLQAAGESTENIEDYDLSEITFREDGTTDKIIFEGRKSTIYGCYVEEEKPTEDTTTEEEQPGENPEQGAEETATEVEIISDDVNLRTQPDAEADNVAAVAYTGERYPLLETVEAGEATWYKIQYTNPETGEVAELYVRSDFAKLVEGIVEVTDDETVEIAEEPGTVTELTYEDEQVSVVVSATEEGIIPEGAKLSVTPITADNADTQAQYDEVAQQIQEKVAEEEVAGFLAYDITFVDGEGKKVEPNGEVKVTMDYKEPVIPEEVSAALAESETAESDSMVYTIESETGNEIVSSGEETNTTSATDDTMQVTVMHLEEDESGNVKDVVDMSENNQLQLVDTTDSNEVKKVEFTTDSFSVFTITFKRGNNDSVEFKIVLKDLNGNEIGTDGTDHYSVSGDLLEKTPSSIAPDVDGYCFIKAIAEEDEDTQTIIERICAWPNRNERESIELKYVDGTPKRFLGTNERITFYYAELKDTIEKEETIDSTAKGVNIYMNNYGYSNAIHSSIGGPYGYDVTQGLVETRLGSDGFPVTTGGTSLSNWFTKNEARKVNNLFLKSAYEKDGTFYYSSFENYAYLGDSSDFTVYKGLGTSVQSGGDSFFNRGNFFPYNRILEGVYSDCRNLFDEHGDPLSTSDAQYDDPLYKTIGDTDFHFSMYLEANFIQEENGQYNGQDMIYEFNGDDDLWVFIDDKLVLDMGGVHDARSGSINFSTGEVVVNNSNNAEIRTTLQRALGLSGTTFEDYSAHTLKMFYMERNGNNNLGASNLKVKFNLPTIPEEQIEVRKELDNTDKEKYANVNFAFQVYAQEVIGHDEQDNEIYSNNYVRLNADSGAYLKDTNTPIIFEGNVSFEGDSESPHNDVFYLKPGQTAVFPEMQKNRKYYVREVGINAKAYDKVVINSTEIDEYTKDDQVSGTIKAAQSSEAEVSKRPLIVFTNNCSAYNENELRITKQIEGDVPTEDTFKFRIYLENQAGELEPYSGKYYMTDKDGNYYAYNEKGVLENKGSKVEDAVVCGETTDGIVKDIEEGFTVSLTGILSGTNFKVEEVERDETKYGEPTKDVDKCKPGTIKDDNGKIISDGTIDLGSDADAEVTITNHPYKTIQVQKEWKNGDETITNVTEPVYVGLYNEDGTPVAADKYLVLNTGNSYTNSFGQLSSTDYLVYELRPVTGGKTPEFTIGGTSYVKAAANEIVQIGNFKYQVSYGDLTADTTNGLQSNITITNTRAGKVIVQKTWTDGSTDKEVLVGLFTNDTYVEDKYATLNSDNSWRVEFTVDGQVDEYTAKELILDEAGPIVIDDQKYKAVADGEVIRINDDYYKVSSSEAIDTTTTDKTVTITNERLAILNIHKVGMKDGNEVNLSGAEFKLKKGDTYIKDADDNDIVVTTDANGNASFPPLQDGTYTIEEIKAPEGYQLPTKKEYTVTLAYSGSIVPEDNGGITVVDGSKVEKEDGKTYYYEVTQKIVNTMLYSLPSTGGSGIFGYMIGGVALMMAAMFILYKMRSKGVLRS